MMEFSPENLENALSLFYRTESQQQAEAHLWLTEAQNSPQAWSFVWELLNPHKSSEVQFFAATTLHTKLMKNWNEVPEDHYEPLKKHLLEAIVNYAMGPKIVLKRLCIALSAYVIHTIPNYWPKAFEELVASFQPHHLPSVEPETVIWILLEILTVIPEEFESTTLAQNQRNRVRIALHDVSKDILKIIEMCLMPLPAKGFDLSNLTTYLNASKCASAWIQLGGLNIDDCTSVMNLLIDLTCFAYWNKSDPECLVGEEMDLMETTVEALTNIFQHPLTHKYKSFVTKYAALILFKFEKILEAEKNLPEMNKDVVACLYGLIITIAERHSKIFVENIKSQNLEDQRISFDLFTSILKCTNLPGWYPIDESSSTLTFGFWYTLQDDIIALDVAESTPLILAVKPYYRDLVCIMLRKSMYPNREDNNWSLDDKEVFRCYRQDIADTFMYCYGVLNLEMLDILSVKLNEALRKDCSNGSAQPIQWNEVETVLHAYGSIAEHIEFENLYLPKLMSLIRTIPFHELNMKVLSTALETIGYYSEWFIDHPENLEHVFPLILSTLSNPEASMNSTLALKDICHNCQKYLTPFATHIIMASQGALQNGNLKLAECRRLMYCIGRVLSVLPVNSIMGYLNMILSPSFDDLQKLVNSEPSVTVATSVGTRLKIISSLVNALFVDQVNVEQPILLVMQNTMPLYRTISELYYQNTEVMEDLSILLKYTLTTLRDDCAPLLNDMLHIVVTVYRKHPQAHILVVAKTILLLFGKEDKFKEMTMQLLHEINNTSLQLCAQYNNKNDLSEKSDVLEGFFTLLSNIAKKVPQLITGCGVDTSDLFQCAILCLVLPEIATLKAVSCFLVQYISQSRETMQAEVVQNFGESLVLRILMNLGTTAPRASVDIFGDIFLMLNKKYCDNLSRWLNTLLSQEGFPSHRISARQKELFVKSILKEKTNKRKVCDSILEFTLICRGILKPESHS